MLSILVCHSYFLRLDQKQLERGKPYPPLATLQVAAMLRKCGHEVAFFDAMLADGIEDYDRTLARRRTAVGALLRGHFQFFEQDVLGHDAACGLRNDRLGAPQRRHGDRRGPRRHRCSGALPARRSGFGFDR